MASAVNVAMTMLYWRIGRRISRELLGEERAEYGEEIVSTLSRQLQTEFGRGFSAKNLKHMIRFAEAFPDLERKLHTAMEHARKTFANRIEPATGKDDNEPTL